MAGRSDQALRSWELRARARLSPATTDSGYFSMIWEFWGPRLSGPQFCPYHALKLLGFCLSDHSTSILLFYGCEKVP